MIKLDKQKLLETKIIDLTLKSLKLNHPYYNSYEKIVNMYTEFYLYTHYYLEYIYTIRTDDIINKRLDKIFDKNYQIKSNKDLNYIKYTLSDITKNRETHRILIPNENKIKYKSMTISLGRKIKIAKLLIKNDKK